MCAALAFILLLFFISIVGLQTKYRSYFLKLKDKIIWNSIIRYTITSYLNYAIISVINVRDIFNVLDPFKSIFKMFLAIAVTVYPFSLLTFLQQNLEWLKSKNAMKKYSSAYSGIKITSSTICYITIFLYRRLFIAILIFLNNKGSGL